METPNVNIQEEPKKKFHAFKYWAEVVKWFVTLIGNTVDFVKEKPFPKKADYES